MDEYHVYDAGIVGAACDKNHNSFLAHVVTKVAHHCCKLIIDGNFQVWNILVNADIQGNKDKRLSY